MRAKEIAHLQRRHRMPAASVQLKGKSKEETKRHDDFFRTMLLSNQQAAGFFENDMAPGSNLLYSAVLCALDVLGIGWIACDPSSHVRGINRTAENILKDRDGLELDCDGLLRSTCDENISLAQAVKQAFEPTRFINLKEQDVTLGIRRPSGKPPLTLIIRRVQGTQDEPIALLLTLDTSICSTATAVELYLLYRFSSEESRLALLLLEGRTLEDCCHEVGIDLSTGKTHLRSVFEKTGVHSQSEFVMALYKNIVLTRLQAEVPVTNTSALQSTVQ
jgi:DNA-binding NarL/FixJ family response regulator